MNELSGASETRIGNQAQFYDWLDAQPESYRAQVADVLGARAALRVLPVAAAAISPMQDEKKLLFRMLVLAVFRATAAAWCVVKYPARSLERVGRVAPTTASEAVLAAARAATTNDILVHVASAAGAAADPATTPFAVSHAANAANPNGAPFWRAVEHDTRAVHADGHDALTMRPLWPEGTPDRIDRNWRALRAVLPPDENWQVWIDWYEDRLAGRSRGEAHELVFASVPEAEWDKGPATANAWIKAHLPKERELPRPLPDVPSAFTFGWNASARISIVAGAQNAVVFPFAPNAGDHVSALDASRRLVERLLADLKTRRINCTRLDYQQALERYADDLPTTPGSGNLMLADAEARMLRDLFAAEVDILSPGFAARLKIILQQHIALRAFYPEVARFYDAVQSGHLERPLPEDAVADVSRTIAANTPRYFEPEVSDGLRQVARDAPQVTLSPDDVAGHGGATIQPPPDPLGQLEPAKSRSFSVASAINSLWKTFLKGKDIPEAAEGWGKVADTLGENVGPVLDWLKDFLPKG